MTLILHVSHISLSQKCILFDVSGYFAYVCVWAPPMHLEQEEASQGPQISWNWNCEPPRGRGTQTQVL